MDQHAFERDSSDSRAVPPAGSSPCRHPGFHRQGPAHRYGIAGPRWAITSKTGRTSRFARFRRRSWTSRAHFPHSVGTEFVPYVPSPACAPPTSWPPRLDHTLACKLRPSIGSQSSSRPHRPRGRGTQPPNDARRDSTDSQPRQEPAMRTPPAFDISDDPTPHKRMDQRVQCEIFSASKIGDALQKRTIHDGLLIKAVLIWNAPVDEPMVIVSSAFTSRAGRLAKGRHHRGHGAPLTPPPAHSRLGRGIEPPAGGHYGGPAGGLRAVELRATLWDLGATRPGLANPHHYADRRCRDSRTRKLIAHTVHPCRHRAILVAPPRSRTISHESDNRDGAFRLPCQLDCNESVYR